MINFPVSLQISKSEPSNGDKQVCTKLVNPFITEIPLECLQNILNNLGFKDLIRFEMASKNHPPLTQYNWKKLKDKFYPFEWEICQKMQYPDKSNFCLSWALRHYLTNYYEELHTLSPVAPLSKFQENGEMGVKIMSKFGTLMECYPYLNMFINEDLVKYCSAFSNSKDTNQKEKILKAALQKWGGEALMVALLKIKQAISNNRSKESFKFARFYLDLALDNKVTRAYQFISPVLRKEIIRNIQRNHMQVRMDIFESAKEMAIQCVLKGNKGALKLFLSHYFLEVPKVSINYFQSLFSPSVIKNLTKKELPVINCGQRLQHWQTAYQIYQNYVNNQTGTIPTNVLECSVAIEFKLNQHIAIRDVKQGSDLNLISYLNYYFNPSQENDTQLRRVLNNEIIDNLSLEVLKKTNFNHLLQWQKAKQIYQRTIKSYGKTTKVPAHVLECAQYIDEKCAEMNEPIELE